MCLSCSGLVSQTDDAAFTAKIRSSDLLTSANTPFMWCFNCTAGSVSSDYPFPFCPFFYKQSLVASELMMQHTNRPHQQRNTAVGFQTDFSTGAKGWFSRRSWAVSSARTSQAVEGKLLKTNHFKCLSFVASCGSPRYCTIVLASLNTSALVWS